MMNKLIHWDTELLVYFNNLGTNFWDPFWIQVSGVVMWIPLYALLLFFIVKKKSGKAMWFALLAIVLNVVLTDQGSVQLFKEQFLRLRPCHVDEILERIRLVKGRCGGQYGFISSHATNTFGLALLAGNLLKPHFKYALPLLILWAALVSYSRVYLGVHYPGDILGGAIFGSLIGWLVFKGYQKMLAK